ncbi:MAG: VOC family protein [Chloroflexi bacterium]|nr:VOC family protein [Chloroflexota bacterium]
MAQPTEYFNTKVIVNDMEKALGFYQDFLGLRARSQRIITPGIAEVGVYERLFGVRSPHFWEISMETDPELHRGVTLIQWYSPQGKPRDQNLRMCDPGFAWVGIPLQVPPRKELRTTYERAPHSLINKFISPPMHLTGLPDTYRCCFCYDPDGNLVELTTNDHLSTVVKDMDRMLAFYRDTLGLKVGFDDTVTPDSLRGREYEMLLGIPTPHVRVVRLFCENDLASRNGGIEFLQWFSPQGQPLEGKRNIWDVGPRFAAIMVRNLDAVYDELVGKGIECFSPSVEHGAWKALFLYDPEGNIFELIDDVSHQDMRR